jgi:hypothetical protein
VKPQQTFIPTKEKVIVIEIMRHTMARRMADHDTMKKRGLSSLVLTMSVCLLCFFLGRSSTNTAVWKFDSVTKKGQQPQAVVRQSTKHQGHCEEKLDQFQNVWDERRKVRNDLVKQHTEGTGDSDTNSRLIFDLFEPEAVCITEERFGGSAPRYNSFGDGPKFICGVDYIHECYNGTQGNDNCIVYSIGSNNEIDFEVAVKDHIGCEIHTFDPTLSTPFIGSAYATFHPWGLGKDGEVVNFVTEFTTMSLESIMKELGHTHRKIDIFKIDCEGCEYDAMPAVFEAIANGTLQIDQILIELHQSIDVNNFFAAADKAGYRITHKERNHWGCDGYKCVEYGLVSEDFLRRSTSAAIC